MERWQNCVRKDSCRRLGKSTVRELSDYISVKHPEIKGFSAQNIWRMKQFFETYVHDKKLSTLLRELPWSHNILIMGQPSNDNLLPM